LLALPNIAGMKITDRDLYTFGLIQSFSGGRLQLFSGADEVMCHAVLCGAAGSVEAGRTFMLRFQTALAEVLAAGSIWSFLRGAMRLKYGLDVGMPRPPLGSADKHWADADLERLIDLVDSAISDREER
jgi:N-acetylneuraminate lyase